MALNRYVLVKDITLSAGAFTPDAGVYGTGSYAQAASEYGSGGASWRKGQLILADPSGALYTAIGAGNLRAFVDGTDTAGHSGISN